MKWASLYNFKLRSTLSTTSPLLLLIVPADWPFCVFADGKKLKKGCCIDRLGPGQWTGSSVVPWNITNSMMVPLKWNQDIKVVQITMKVYKISVRKQRKGNMHCCLMPSLTWYGRASKSGISSLWRLRYDEVCFGFGGASVRKSPLKPPFSLINFFLLGSDKPLELEGPSLKRGAKP